jgi:hypothetical protein
MLCSKLLPPAPTAIEAAAEYQHNQQDDDYQGGVIHCVLPALGWTQFTENHSSTAHRYRRASRDRGWNYHSWRTLCWLL